MFVELVATAGEHSFGQRAVVEVVEEEPQDVAVVVVDYECAVLVSEHDVVGDPQQCV